MKRLISIVITVALLLSVSAVAAVSVAAEESNVQLGNGTTYYVDSLGGNDSNAGTSSSAAWKSLDKVNATTFKPGDNILFKKGGVWDGTLYPKGSGENGAPITISSYGDSLAMPLINGNGEYFLAGDRDDAAVYLYNQSYWTISNLEVTNFDTVLRDRYGIHIDGSKGSQQGIKIIGCRVHDVSNDGNSGDHGRLSGIAVWSRDWNTVFTDVLVENNEVYAIGSTGIYINGLRSSGETTNTRVANNYLYDIGGDGVLVVSCVKPVVEYNVVNESHNKSTAACVALWPFECTDALFQFNEAYNTKTIADGQGFDCDFMCKGTVFQYNYGHDNEGGFFLICTEATNWDGSKIGFNDDVIVRYNIGQNNMARQFVLSGGILNTQIYNNTVYIKQGTVGCVFYVFSRDQVNWPTNTKVYNNIFYHLGSGGYDMYGCTDTQWDHNVFYGTHPNNEPDDPHKITADPMFFKPGGATVGLETCDAYVLKQGSPAIGAGRVIENNGGRDYFGNPVSATAAPNIGAYNGPGVDSSFVMRTATTRATHTTAYSTAAPTQPTTAPTGTDLARGKVSYASSAEGDNTADKAFDGGRYTRWSSKFTDSEWIYVDLGAVYSVDQVRLIWESAYGTEYKIQTSLDGESWTDQYVETAGDGDIDDIFFNAANARYVRMQGEKRATIYGYSLYEFGVYSKQVAGTTQTPAATTNKATTVPTTTATTHLNVALGKTVNVSNIRNNSSPEKLVDGEKSDAAKRLDMPTGEQWITIDLGSTYNVDGVNIYWEARAKDYTVQLSTDGQSWTTVQTVTENPQNGYPSLNKHTFTSTPAKYVKVNMTSLYSQWGYGICEIEVLSPNTVQVQTTTAKAPTYNNPYVVSGGYLSGVTDNDVAEFIASFNAENGAAVKVFKGSDEVTSGKVGTDMDVVIYENGTEKSRYTIVIYGDVNGDGETNASDLLIVKRHLLSVSPLEGSYLEAAKVNRDSNVSAADMLKLKRVLLSVDTITQ
ncbi:MAG: discoidin domain-containing protein [Clostridia bacterium]|nr:discoidin domain-containing protein [Clostridia bacterium]